MLPLFGSADFGRPDAAAEDGAAPSSFDVMACEVCRAQPLDKRLRMEVYAERAVGELTRALREEGDAMDPSEQRLTLGELDRAERVLDELKRHRRHSLFFKVVAVQPKLLSGVSTQQEPERHEQRGKQQEQQQGQQEQQQELRQQQQQKQQQQTALHEPPPPPPQHLNLPSSNSSRAQDHQTFHQRLDLPSSNLSRAQDHQTYHHHHNLSRAQDHQTYVSVYDGRTEYRLNQRCGTQETGGASGNPKHGGCFVHTSLEAAERSVEAFPRSSLALDQPRRILAVRGEGRWRYRHGKVLFEAITPLGEIPSASDFCLRSSWR